MTIIEFFENESQIENVISTLLCAPDKVIMLGDAEKKMAKCAENYKKVAAKRGINVEFFPVSVNRNNLMSIVDTIEEIVSENEDCIIDLSGGDDLSLVAIGIVYADNADKIKLHRFSITNSTMTDCDSDGKLCTSASLELTIEEIVAINGGSVVYTNEKPMGTFRWDFNSEFVDDVYAMWSVCRQNPAQWNIQLGFLSLILSLQPDPESLSVCIDLKKFRSILERKKEKNEFEIDIFRQLGKLGVIENFKADSQSLSFTFKNDQIKKCLTKSGQVFELYLALSAAEITDNDGAPLYTDIMTGVFIDWDGEIHPDSSDVENEVDLILMRGLMPVFISCKNGAVPIDELYKLSVVSRKFGGKYVRNVLAATYVDEKPERIKYVRERTDAMGIKFWDQLHKTEESKFEKDLKNLWRTT